jgi:hypothetical protein
MQVHLKCDYSSSFCTPASQTGQLYLTSVSTKLQAGCSESRIFLSSLFTYLFITVYSIYSFFVQGIILIKRFIWCLLKVNLL